MYALLGDIQFDLITYFDGFESQFGADFAEHALIAGKPRLQFIGDKLDEIRIQLAFHAYYCDPEAELAKLKAALAAHQAMTLVLGNGDYKGWFVLTAVQAFSRHTDQAGTLIALEANITLLEFVGDKKNPLQPLAVQPKLPPAAAQTLSTSQALSKATSATMTVRDGIRQAVTYANQAQSALRVAVDAARVAQKLGDNPQAAVGRIPGLLASVKQASGPLESLSPTLSSLTSQLPEAASILRASDNALGAVRNGQSALSLVSTATVTSRIDYLAGQLSTATGALESVAPSISKLASKVVTRAI
ncbi:phage tail protein (plasmid) [Ralstonia syzygii subsp. celebesensis]|uniref:phage tail protein n=1 Tax=Ralstonia solanacearum species complex TaxID=3116862 RepID=UPI000B3B9AE0|nr:hypothetical protein RSSE_p0692 [Ralstonia solanacearum]